MMGSLSSLVENQKKGMKSIAEGFPQFHNFFKTLKVSEELIAELLKKNEFPLRVARLLLQARPTYLHVATQGSLST